MIRLNRSLIFQWLQDVNVPDEFFFPTLIRVSPPAADGRITQDVAAESPLALTQRDFGPGGVVVPRFTAWESGESWRNGPWSKCRGEYKRDICNFSLLDLPWVREASARSLFLNKFYLRVDALAVACWAEHVATAQGKDVT